MKSILASKKLHWVLCLLLLVLVGGTAAAKGRVRVLLVQPDETGAAIKTVHGPHLAVYDPEAPDRHKLILMLVGTGGKAASSRGVDRAFAGFGFHVVSLDYENNVITAGICAHSGDDACYQHYHQEIIAGRPVSPKVNVDRANSILHRFRALLLYLVKHDAGGGWKQFLKNRRPNWGEIIVAGHSQGSGHAAYLGKMFRLSRVLLFSGPQDYRADLHRPAAWLSKKGKTPPDRYYAFLHEKDPFNVKHQLANCDALMDRTQPEILKVEPGVPIHGTRHILVTDIPTKNPHGSTLFPEFRDVWKYMLTAK